jgi:tRNA A-37 threonylcarbamoyl transferase component Bud32
VVLAEAARGANDVSQPSQPIGAPRTLRVGESLLRRYEIRRFIAKGGMGEVYEAFDAALSETVALKTLALSSVDEPGAAERLRGEVRLARKVTHPNVCRILEFGVHRASGTEADVVPFLTMELLRGETLARVLARTGRFNEALALKLLREIVSGLEAVHAAGVIHRDLKSENVFLSTSPDGLTRAVVMDFGLAQVHHLREESRKSSGGAVIGTLDYMAPEQVEGRPATPASDIYALGVVVFEMLTGRLPHAGQTQFARAAAKLVAAPPRPSANVRGLSTGWDALVRRCLERNPSDRPNLREVARAIERLSASARRVRSSVAAGIIFCAAVAVLVVGARAGTRREAHGHEGSSEGAIARAVSMATAATPNEDPPLPHRVDEPSVRTDTPPRSRTRRDRVRVRTLPAAAAPADREGHSDRNDPFARPESRPAHPDDLIDPFHVGVAQ